MLRPASCAAVALLSITIAAHAADTTGPKADADKAGDAKASKESPAVAIGSQVGELTFNDIRFLPRSLKELGEKKAYVFVFTTLDCPIARRYMPRIVALEKAFRDKGVQFVNINVGANDPLVEVAYQAVELNAPFPFCKDFSGDAVKALGVSRTPEAVVLDAAHKLRYRGRIDSQFRLGGVRDDAGRDDLRLALEDVLAGRDVAISQTPVDGCLITMTKPPKVSGVTFTEHIAPLMQKHCQDCHHTGGSAPFALMSYDDAAANAEMIAEVVKERRMPPMYASLQHGDFTNLRLLTSEERTMLIGWVAEGKPLGDPAKMPKPRTFPGAGQWLIGKPDLVLTIAQEAKIPANGILPYQYKLLHYKSKVFPYIFPEDTWISACQILPGNREAVHHCNMAYIDPKGKYTDAQFITGQVPGGQPMVLRNGIGFKIPKGCLLVLQLHYVTTGKEASDQTRVGFVFAKETINKQLKHFRCHNARFAITPGDPHHPVEAKRTLDCDATGVGMFSHMHLRGKDMVFNAIYPGGKKEILLAVPNYSFDWQMAYEWAPNAKKFPKGTVIDVVAHYDNSPFNPFNPDPKQTVKEGDQTYDEMMYGFFFYTDDAENLHLKVDPKTGFALGGEQEAAGPTKKSQSGASGGR
jgi:thiol-disulfide isomerase/thioredoxin